MYSDMIITDGGREARIEYGVVIEFLTRYLRISCFSNIDNITA